MGKVFKTSGDLVLDQTTPDIKLVQDITPVVTTYSDTMDKWSNMFLRNRAKTHKTDMHTCTYITYKQRKTLTSITICNAPFLFCVLPSLQNY